MFETDEKTITLRKPVTLGSGDAAVTYAELKLREPTAGELEKSSKADTSIGMTINLISIVAKVPRAVAERLSQRDLGEVGAYLNSFTEPGQPEEAAGQS